MNKIKLRLITYLLYWDLFIKITTKSLHYFSNLQPTIIEKIGRDVKNLKCIENFKHMSYNLFIYFNFQFLSDMSTKSEVRLLVLGLELLFLMLCGVQVESKQYLRCELTKVMVQNYRVQKYLMSNCELSCLYSYYIINWTRTQGSAWWSMRVIWIQIEWRVMITIAKTTDCFKSTARTTVQRDVREESATWSVKVVYYTLLN